MVDEARPELTPEKRGASRTLKKGAIRACCFLRRHDPFRFEGSSDRIAPQSQSSAEDTPTSDLEKSGVPSQLARKTFKHGQPPKNTRAAPDEGAARVT